MYDNIVTEILKQIKKLDSISNLNGVHDLGLINLIFETNIF